MDRETEQVKCPHCKAEDGGVGYHFGFKSSIGDINYWMCVHCGWVEYDIVEKSEFAPSSKRKFK